MFCKFYFVIVAVSLLDSSYSRHTSSRLQTRLEEEIDEIEGDSEKIRNVCCKRMTNKIVIGKGSNGEDMEVDVGMCRQSCAKKPSKMKKKDFELLLKDLDPNIDPIEFYLSLQKDTVFDSCTAGFECNPSVTQLERYFTADGVVEVPIIKSCTCARVSSECRLAEKWMLYFPGTPYERMVDVGACQGTSDCSEDSSCRPTKNSTISLEGPNGLRCFEVIEECGCKPSCYRATKLEHIYDYTNVEEDNEGAKPDLLTIDVGMCVGTCNAEGQRVKKCVIRDPENPRKCLSSLTHRPTGCQATAFRTHEYVNKYRQKRSVLAISHCSCQ